MALKATTIKGAITTMATRQASIGRLMASWVIERISVSNRPRPQIAERPTGAKIDHQHHQRDQPAEQDAQRPAIAPTRQVAREDQQRRPREHQARLPA